MCVAWFPPGPRFWSSARCCVQTLAFQESFRASKQVSPSQVPKSPDQLVGDPDRNPSIESCVTHGNNVQSKSCMPSPIAFSIGRMVALLLVAGALNLFVPLLSGQAATPSAPAQRVPVLVELFTSEGCSDCPPADALLAKLDATQPISGVQAIVLSEHVTYWNHQGWSDPFSFEMMTERQEDYGRRFGLDSNYTPQMVVDGVEQFVGSNSRALVAAVEKEQKTPKQSIVIDGATWDHGAAQFSIRASVPTGARNLRCWQQTRLTRRCPVEKTPAAPCATPPWCA